MWPFSKTAPKTPDAPAEETTRGSFLTHIAGRTGFARSILEEALQSLLSSIRLPEGVAMDSAGPNIKGGRTANLPEALIGWFASQSFIGYPSCAMLSQNWLIDKALTMPARDATRHGYAIHVKGAEAVPDANSGNEDEIEGQIVDRLRELDKEFRVNHNLEQYIKMGRTFGIRILLFRVRSADPLYYEKPFNIDGVTAGSYEGMSQIDPYWVTPTFDAAALTDPTSPEFYEPTWWEIQGKRYHRSHLCIFRASEVPDLLKPSYLYGGIPVPQQIAERVYAAERTANEGPQLAMTKRLTVWKTDLAELYANQEAAARHLSAFTEYRDNYGVKLVDTEDSLETTDTGLADLDVTIMTQYQLVAAAARVPATKLLGTTPKGFSATGEYDESSYHEELETIQSSDLSPVLDRHYSILLRSHVEVERGVELGKLSVVVDWAPLDSPTAKEYAEINQIHAATDAALVSAGAIDGQDVRNRIKTDSNSGYAGIADVALEDDLGLAASKDPLNLGA